MKTATDAKSRNALFHLRYINHHFKKIVRLARQFLLSTVVLMELMAGASDASELKRYQSLSRDYSKDNSLIVPSLDDWLLASKVLYWLGQDRRRRAGGRSPRLVVGATQRLALDAHIATSARSWQATVITENRDDFKAIQRYCNVKLVKGSDFFR